jgi:hypothetical protein
MKSIKSERGQVLVILALAAIGIFGIVGLAIDGSAKFSDRRHAQNAADTAALAAALAKVNALTGGLANSPITCPPPVGTPPSDVCAALQTAGLDRAGSNGYDNNLVSNTVEIYSPPISGYYTGNESYVQVIITSHVNTSFARVVGIDQTHNEVQAVALTEEGGLLGDGAMIISYDPDPNCSSGGGSGGGSVDVSGSGILNLNGGGIFLNSDEVCGYSAPNCPTINISGGAGINSAATVDNIDQSCVSADEFINQDPVSIPNDVYFPDAPPECGMAAPTPTLLGVAPDGKQEWIIYPGYYTDFPQASLIPNNKHIYMYSGTYCIDPPANQDLHWSGSSFSSLNGSTDPSKNDYHVYNPDGVTLYLTSGGGFSLSINSPILLDASTSGDYQGYLMILEGTHTSIESCEINGGSYLDINGLIFAPYCDITINGGGEPTAEINAQLIGWDIKLTGNNTINFNYDPSNQVTIKHKVGLMR